MKTNKAVISFKPKQVSKKLLSGLNGRMRDIVTNRYGLDKEKRMTLESIGQQYDITRERVRQIENFALSAMKKSDEYKEHGFVFDELKQIIKDLGSVVKEDSLLNHITKDEVIKNHINLYLVIGGHFTKIKETDHFNSHWSIDDFTAKHVSDSLTKLHETITEQDLLKEEEVIERFVTYLDQLVDDYRNNKDTIHRYLSLSKMIGKNQLNEWGKSTSPHIRAGGIKDYAYLVIRKECKPMHFKDVATKIAEIFKRQAHVATCHNELIKDKRFVLVGRGMYGLKEWGHAAGVVKDVIKSILEENGQPMTKEEVIKTVLEKRLVKPNTILVNLQNSKYFKRDKDNKYSVIK